LVLGFQPQSESVRQGFAVLNVVWLIKVKIEARICKHLKIVIGILREEWLQGVKGEKKYE
jgi:hypothetical protein